MEEAGQRRGTSPSVFVSIHLGLRGVQGDLQTQSHLQRDPNTPVTSFPDWKASPQPATGVGGTGCQSSGGLAAGWVRGQRVVAVGAVAGRWEIDRGTRAAPGEWCSPTTAVASGHYDTGDTGDTGYRRGQCWRCHRPATPACGRASGYGGLL